MNMLGVIDRPNPEGNVRIFFTSELFEAMGRAGVSGIFVDNGEIRTIRGAVDAIRRDNRMLSEYTLPKLGRTALVLRQKFIIGMDSHVLANNGQARYVTATGDKISRERLRDLTQHDGLSIVEASVHSLEPHDMAAAVGEAYVEYPFYPTRDGWWRNLIYGDTPVLGVEYERAAEVSRPHSPLIVTYRDQTPGATP